VYEILRVKARKKYQVGGSSGTIEQPNIRLTKLGESSKGKNRGLTKTFELGK
jgi:hypothetical protein